MKTIFFTILMVLVSVNSFAVGKIQKQGVKTLTDCTNGGATGANCLIDTTQLWDVTNSQQLSSSISSGALGSTSSSLLNNVGLATSVSANALTISLKTGSGANPSGSSAVGVGFRNSTSATGQYSLSNVTSALSITVPSGTTIGTNSGLASSIFVYLLNNSGAVEMAVSLYGNFDNGSVQNTTAISGGSLGSVLYSTTARTGVPVRLIGRIAITEATAGTWASNATEVSLAPFTKHSGFASATILTACSTATCTLTQSLNITSVTRSSTGVYLMNFAPGTFLNPPACTLSSVTYDITPPALVGANTFTNIAVDFVTRNNGGIPIDSGVQIICVGL